MAVPMGPASLVQMLRAEGVKVVEVPGWRTHNRNAKGEWGPLNGVMIHHTVTGPKVDGVRLCYDGLSDLPGPLCHGVIRRNGEVHLVGNGRANHAGGGDPRVLAAVRDENYGEVPTKTQQHQGSPGAVDGNAHFYGFECENLGDGKDPWPEAQVQAVIRTAAAICRFYGWSAKSVIGHKEWSDWKDDPKGPGDVVAMPRLRGKIQERLSHDASWSPTPATKPTPAPPAPNTGAIMTVPARLVLSRPESLTLLQDVPQTVYWTVEHIDDASSHGAGGKTVLTNGRYTGTLNVLLNGLNSGEGVEIYAVEEDTSGAFLGAADPHVVPGNGGTGSIVPQVSVPVTGSVNQRLVFQVVNRQETPVMLTKARLSLLTWSNV